MSVESVAAAAAPEPAQLIPLCLLQHEYEPDGNDYIPRIMFADPDGTVSDAWHHHP